MNFFREQFITHKFEPLSDWEGQTMSHHGTPMTRLDDMVYRTPHNTMSHTLDGTVSYTLDKINVSIDPDTTVSCITRYPLGVNRCEWQYFGIEKPRS